MASGDPLLLEDVLLKHKRLRVLVMHVFGPDFPNQVVAGIDAIMAAEFLGAEQKADILCNNAARFLALDAAICAP